MLERFPTQELLSFAAVSRRFYGLVSRLHYGRLVEAVTTQDHELILECYHPSAKISTPYMFCDYLGTDGLEDAGQDPMLKNMKDLYSRYCPVLGEEHRRPRARYPTKAVATGPEPPAVEKPSHEVHLETLELFSQLCTVVNLIKVSSKRGWILSSVNMVESVIRIWRDWLANEAYQKSSPDQNGAVKFLDAPVLWTDDTQNFGIRVRVVEQPDLHAPILVGPGEDPPVSYMLEYEGIALFAVPLPHIQVADKSQNFSFEQTNSCAV